MLKMDSSLSQPLPEFSSWQFSSGLFPTVGHAPTLPSSISPNASSTSAFFPTYGNAVDINRNSQVATKAVSEYLRWYQNFVEHYHRDMDAAGEEDWGYINFAYKEGIPTLQKLMSSLYLKNKAQRDSLSQILRGFRRLARYTTDLEGRGVLISVLVTDVIAQLSENGLIDQAKEPLMLTARVGHKQVESPQTSLAAIYPSLSLSKSPAQNLSSLGLAA